MAGPRGSPSLPGARPVRREQPAAFHAGRICQQGPHSRLGATGPQPVAGRRAGPRRALPVPYAARHERHTHSNPSRHPRRDRHAKRPGHSSRAGYRDSRDGGRDTGPGHSYGSGSGNGHSERAGHSHSAVQAANPYGGTLVLDDNFTNNGNPNGWTCGTNATMTYQNDGLHIVNNSTTDAVICIPQNANLVVSNFAAQLQMTVASGTTGGLAFYINNSTTPPTYYSLVVSADNTTYTLVIMNGTPTTLVSGRANSQIMNFAIVSGGATSGGCNGNLKVFINQQCLNSTSNTTFTGGMIGLYIPPASEVVFHHIKFWTGL